MNFKDVKADLISRVSPDDLTVLRTIAKIIPRDRFSVEYSDNGLMLNRDLMNFQENGFHVFFGCDPLDLLIAMNICNSENKIDLLLNSKIVRYPFFYAIIDEDTGCHVEISHRIGTNGYPKIKHHRDIREMHRLVSKIVVDRPVQGKVVRHLCDNKFCINPDHLRTGSQKDNMEDMVRNGKSCYGERHPKSKLKIYQVCAIIKNNKISAGVLSSLMGVSKSAIDGIRQKKNWLNVWDNLEEYIVKFENEILEFEKLIKTT